MSNTSFTLKHPIIGHGGTIRELSLKMPTARSFMLYGNPFVMKFDERDNPVPEYTDKAMFKFLADATGIDEITLEGLSAADYITARTKLTYLMLGVTGSDENPSEASAA